MEGLLCPFCLFFAPSQQLLHKHVISVHSLDSNFKIQCDCLRTFRNYRTYQNHQLCCVERSRVLLQQSSPSDSSAINFIDSNQTLEPEPQEQEIIDCHGTESFDMKKYGAQWILKTSESRSLTRTAMTGIIEDVTELVTMITKSICEDMKQFVSENSVDMENFANTLVTRYSSPFTGISSFHQQIQYYKTNFGLVEPRRIVLNCRHIQKISGRKRRTVLKKDEMFYVPLLLTLEKLLQNDSVLKEVLSGHQSSTDVLSDYCDGSIFKKHPLFSSDPSGLQIIFYYDDLELCNPLGSRRKIHKVGAFYFMLGNLSPKYRSRVNLIQLIALTKSSVIQQHGMDKILEPFIKDIKLLESGVVMNIKGQDYNFKGTIIVLSADNPASQELGGFKQGHTAFCKCRHCLCTDTDIQSKFRESSAHLRNAEKHNQQCTRIEEQTKDDMYQHYSVLYGINRRSILDSLTYFKVATGALIPDIMHDLLEGVLVLETKLMLKEFVSRKIVTLQTIDDNFEKLNFLYMDKRNKPAPVFKVDLSSSECSLKQHAMQMWTFSRFLPLIIAHLITEDNEFWLNFLRLLDIIDILFATSISKETCAYLESLISDHHISFRQLYPSVNVTPKMHGMIHMPRLILEYGPLLSYWTARFEAKHRYFKHLAHVTGNFTNICFSLSLRHQLYQCYLMINTSTLPGEKAEIGPGNVIACPDSPVLHSINTFLPQWITSVNWVRIHGTLYETPSVLVIGKNEDDPVFGELLEIICFNDFILFHVEVLEYMFYSSHYHAHVVSTERCNQKYLIHPDDLVDYLPYGLYLPVSMTSAESVRCVVLKRIINP